MERTPKQRIIFDEDMYDDEFLRDYLAEDYEIYKDELDVSFDEYVEHRRNEGALYDIKERDFTEEMASLRSFLDNGNPLIVSGSIGRWDGTRTGFTVYDNFDAAIDTSPSRFGGDNVFADCEIQKVWDENGHLFIHGAHHDGSVTVELRQLTDAGAVTYEAISEAWNGESFTIIGNNATDWAFKTYDGSEQSFIQAMHDLWEEPSFCQLPHYMEKEFGCPSEEWQLEPLPMEHIGFEDEISEVNGLLNFYIPVTFGVDRVFGTDVESLDNDDWLNIYANYDMARGEVSDHLDISLNRADGSIESLTYPLDAEQRESLRQKMDAYCLEQVGKTLDDYVKEVAESEADSDAAHIADFTVGKYRVHIVPPGGTYGLDGRMTYSLGDADEYGHGLPLVEFYDITQDPVKFPGGQFTGGRYYMSTLLGMESLGDSIENMQALSLDGSIPAWTVGREELQTIYRHLCDIRENFPGTPSERVSLKTEAEQVRAASDKLADERGAGTLAREDPTIV